MSYARAHSLFPPSATARLLACPGSYGQSLAVEPGARRASVFAAEGTLAHLIAEAMLTSTVTDHSFYLGRSFEVEGFVFTVDQPMLDAVQVYVDYIESLRAVGFECSFEKTINPAHLWPDKEPLPLDLFGTADCIAYHRDWQRLVVVDLKFGAGVAVFPEHNPQLLYYAAGALNLVTAPVSNINIVVVQPRLPVSGGTTRQWVTTPEYVTTWARTVLYDGVQTALADMGQTLNPADHCQFCPAFKTCSAPTAAMLDMAREVFAAAGPVDKPGDPNLPDPLAGVGTDHSVMSDDKLRELLDASLIVEPLIEEVRRIAKARIIQGEEIPGWEVIERKGKREWTVSDDELTKACLNAGYNFGQFLTFTTPAKAQEANPTIYVEALAPLVKQGAPVPVLQRERRAGKQAPQPPLALPQAT